MKDTVKKLLEDNSSHDIPHLTGLGYNEANKLVHEIYLKDWGLNDPKYWQTEQVDDDGWAIYGKDFAGEWIDENGEYLCFDTEAEASQYIQETMK